VGIKKGKRKEKEKRKWWKKEIKIKK